jgi:hypothetical protein
MELHNVREKLGSCARREYGFFVRYRPKNRVRGGRESVRVIFGEGYSFEKNPTFPTFLGLTRAESIDSKCRVLFSLPTYPTFRARKCRVFGGVARLKVEKRLPRGAKVRHIAGPPRQTPEAADFRSTLSYTSTPLCGTKRVTIFMGRSTFGPLRRKVARERPTAKRVSTCKH